MTNEELSDEVEYQKFAIDSLVEWGRKLDTFLQNELVTLDRLEQQVEELASKKRIESDHFE